MISFGVPVFCKLEFEEVSTWWSSDCGVVWLAGGRTQGISTCHLCKDLALARFTQEWVEACEVLPVCIWPEVWFSMCKSVPLWTCGITRNRCVLSLLLLSLNVQSMMFASFMFSCFQLQCIPSSGLLCICSLNSMLREHG